MNEPFRPVRLPVNDERLAEVARLGPAGWFRDHATHSLTCGCALTEADASCDVGAALARLAAREIVPRAAVPR